MTTYKGIKGLSIQTVAGDPSVLAAGDIWYDSVAKKVQGAKLGVGAWASGGNMPGPASTNTGFGTLTAGVSAGGELSGASNAEAFHYNGTAWTAGGNINTQRGGGNQRGYGTQTAGALVGGHHPNIPTSVSANHEQYDGTSWSEEGDLNTGRGYQGTANNGTTTAALAFSGLINPETAPNPFGAVGFKTESEEWNGSAWAEGDDLSVGRQYISGAGIQTAALGVGGHSPSIVATTESYDGSSWTEVADLNVGRARLMGGGTHDAAIVAGGSSPSYVNSTEQWDNTSWTEVANLSVARGTGGSGITTSAANGFVAGGQPSGGANDTEEWTYAVAAVTFTSS